VRVTDAPVETIDFGWTNVHRVGIARRLPLGFLMAINDARTLDNKYIDYWSPCGNRIVGRFTSDGHVDYIVNPEPVEKEN